MSSLTVDVFNLDRIQEVLSKVQLQVPYDKKRSDRGTLK